LRLGNIILRNALAQLLPPEFKSKIFPAKQQTRVADALPTPLRAEPQAAQAPKNFGESTFQENYEPHSDVLILSNVDEPATSKLIFSRGLVPLRYSSMNDLEIALSTNIGICAVLVSSSFLVPLNEGEQRGLIKTLAQFSTFAWLRIEDSRLIPSNVDVTELIREARCRTSPPDSLSILFSSMPLQERELEYIENARRRLNSGRPRGLFTPGDFTDAELDLLGAAMALYSQHRQFGVKVELTSVRTKLLQGGKTGAKVALVKVNDLRIPIIVKIFQKEFILGEATRFLTFIFRDNKDLNPEVHMHGSAALIVFDVITANASQEILPAPTLHDRLEGFWSSEMESPSHCGDGAELMAGFESALSRLAALNSQPCPNSAFERFANPYIQGIKEMEREGFSWGFSKAAVERRNTAERLIDATSEAVCHGDAHARNVLIRGEQGYLIDYAYSGPGHPCSDLVRLELTVFLNHFHPFGREADLIGLQRLISFDRLSFDELCSKFPQLVSSATNRLCLKMCVTCRDRVAEVLSAHKLDWNHYIAIKLASAWQALQVPSLQQAAARAIILAIGE